MVLNEWIKEITIRTDTHETLSFLIAFVAFTDPVEFPNGITVFPLSLIVTNDWLVAFLSDIINRNDTIVTSRC